MISYLGKLVHGNSRSLFFLETANGAVAAATVDGGVATVEAWKRFVISRGKITNLGEIQGFLSLHGCSLEIMGTKADEEWIRALHPLERPKSRILEQALAEVEQDLAQEEKEWLDWKGVRDLETAHENLKERQEQLFDLNQKIIHSVQEPQFIYHGSGPPRRTVSAFQQFDRHRYHELKYQVKERASAIRQRIDFTRRFSIKTLKDKRRDLLDELEKEGKREKEHRKTVAAIASQSEAATVVVVVRVGPLVVKGRLGPAAKACLIEAGDLAKKVRRGLADKFGLECRDAPPIGLPTTICTAVRREDLRPEVAKLIERHLSSEPPPALPNVDGWPVVDLERRLVYLGLALKTDGEPTTFPVLFDLDVQGPRHAIAIGSSGSGKSYAASLIAEGAVNHGVRVIVYDPTRSWTGFAQGCSSRRQLSQYSAFGLRDQDVRGYQTQILEPNPGDECPAEGLLRGNGVAVIVPAHLTAGDEGRLLERWLTKLHENVASMPESHALTHLVVIEEAHRLKGHPAVEELLELFARTARVRGVGLVFVTQVLTDLAHGLRSQASTHLLLKTAYSQDLTRAGQIAGKDVQQRIPSLRQATGFVHFADYGAPLLTAFRPPLHSQTALPEIHATLFRAKSELDSFVRALTRHDATSDATSTPLASAVEPAAATRKTADQTPSRATSTTWRDVASRFKGTVVTASAVATEIRDAGLNPPSRRTIQRFLRT